MSFLDIVSKETRRIAVCFVVLVIVVFSRHYGIWGLDSNSYPGKSIVDAYYDSFFDIANNEDNSSSGTKTRDGRLVFRYPKYIAEPYIGVSKIVVEYETATNRFSALSFRPILISDPNIEFPFGLIELNDSKSINNDTGYSVDVTNGLFSSYAEWNVSVRLLTEHKDNNQKSFIVKLLRLEPIVPINPLPYTHTDVYTSTKDWVWKEVDARLTGTVQYSQIEVFRRQALEIVILPPLSNVFLVTLIFILIIYVDRSLLFVKILEESKKHPFKSDLWKHMFLFFLSCFLLVFFVWAGYEFLWRAFLEVVQGKPLAVVPYVVLSASFLFVLSPGQEEEEQEKKKLAPKTPSDTNLGDLGATDNDKAVVPSLPRPQTLEITLKKAPLHNREEREFVATFEAYSLQIGSRSYVDDILDDAGEQGIHITMKKSEQVKLTITFRGVDVDIDDRDNYVLKLRRYILVFCKPEPSAESQSSVLPVQSSLAATPIQLVTPKTEREIQASSPPIDEPAAPTTPEPQAPPTVDSTQPVTSALEPETEKPSSLADELTTPTQPESPAFSTDVDTAGPASSAQPKRDPVWDDEKPDDFIR